MPLLGRFPTSNSAKHKELVAKRGGGSATHAGENQLTTQARGWGTRNATNRSLVFLGRQAKLQVMTPSPPLDAPPAVSATALRTSIAEFFIDRPAGADEDVHMCTAIVDHVISVYSAPGDLVFDPFAGFGTTLIRAIRLGRRAGGIELLPERVAQIRVLAPGASVVAGDARRILPMLASSSEKAEENEPRPTADLVLTSPPYMAATEDEADPLEAYACGDGDYRRYLAELRGVAAECARLVLPGGHVVWNVADIQHAGVLTPLIADCAELLAKHLEQVAVVEIEWDEYPHDIVRDALLVFQRKA